jgi:hypothetical protein
MTEMQKRPVRPLLHSSASGGARRFKARLALGRWLGLKQGREQVDLGGWHPEITLNFTAWTT